MVTQIVCPVVAVRSQKAAPQAIGRTGRLGESQMATVATIPSGRVHTRISGRRCIFKSRLGTHIALLSPMIPIVTAGQISKR